MAGQFFVQGEKYTTEEWLEAISRMRRPWGTPIFSYDYHRKDASNAEFRFVADEKSSGMWFTGTEPVDQGVDNSRGVAHRVFRLETPCVLWSRHGGVVVYATDEQIEKAKWSIMKQSKKIDPAELKRFLIDCWHIAEEHNRECHYDEFAMICADPYECPLQCRYPQWIRSVLDEYKEVKDGGASLLAQFPWRIAAAIRNLMKRQKPKRIELWHEAWQEHGVEAAEKHKAFAQEQMQKIVDLGFGRRRAAEVMKLAGPYLSVGAAEWALVSVETLAPRVTEPGEGHSWEDLIRIRWNWAAKSLRILLTGLIECDQDPYFILPTFGLTLGGGRTREETRRFFRGARAAVSRGMPRKLLDQKVTARV